MTNPNFLDPAPLASPQQTLHFLESIAVSCAGTELPEFSRENQLWIDTNSPPKLKLITRNEANAPKETVLFHDLSLLGGGSLNITTRFAQTFQFTDLAAGTYTVGVAPDATIVAAYLLSNTSTSASDGTDNKSIKIKVSGGSDITVAKTTNGDEITAGTPWALGAIDTGGVSEGDAIQIVSADNGLPAEDLSGAAGSLTIIYTTSVPVP